MDLMSRTTSWIRCNGEPTWKATLYVCVRRRCGSVVRVTWRACGVRAQIEGRAHAPPMPEWYRRRLENRAQIKARKEHDEMQAKKEKLACPAEMSLDFSPQELDEIRDLFMEVRGCTPGLLWCTWHRR